MKIEKDSELIATVLKEVSRSYDSYVSQRSGYAATP